MEDLIESGEPYDAAESLTPNQNNHSHCNQIKGILKVGFLNYFFVNLVKFIFLDEHIDSM